MLPKIRAEEKLHVRGETNPFGLLSKHDKIAKEHDLIQNFNKL